MNRQRKKMNSIKKLFSDYGFVIFVGVFFTLTNIYFSYGQMRSVFWNTYIKSVREIAFIILVIMNFSKLKNVLSILMAFALLGYCSYLTLFRWLSAYVSCGDYKVYIEYMKSDNQSLMIVVFSFIIFVLANYLNGR